MSIQVFDIKKQKSYSSIACSFFENYFNLLFEIAEISSHLEA
jgi:hypothetical protein